MNWLKNIDRQTVWHLLILITAMTFCWNERASSIGIVLLVLHWLADKKLIQKIKSFPILASTILSISFFLFHLVALLWSNYKTEAEHSIEVKLCFLILPILFSTENYLDEKYTQRLFLFFSISCAVSFLYSLSFSFVKFHSFGFMEVINRMNLGKAIMHPGYYSNFFALGFVANVILYFNTKNKKERFIHVLFSVYFFIVLVLLISKTAMIFVFLFFLFVLWKIAAFIKNKIVRIVTFFIFILLFGFLFTQIPMVKNRIIETQIDAKREIINPNFSNSTESRRAAWALEWGLIKEKPIIGYGTGAANPLLLQKFNEKKYDSLIKYNMHTHNQLFHTWIDLGLMGVVFMFGFLGFCLYNFYKQKNEIGFWFTMLVFINLLTDDMLEIQSGAVFFCFFIFLLLFKKQKVKSIY